MKQLDGVLKMDNTKGYAVAVLVALMCVSVLLAAYYPVLKPPAKEFTTIYLLDYQKEAANYPELLIIDQNSTFTVWVGVENHMGKSQYCEVLLKIIADPISLLPVEADVKDRYAKTIENGGAWEFLATVSINEPESYSVIFELWIYDDETGTLEFSRNYCVLDIEVVDQI